ncbi:hypothetical protein VW29_04415 [Devosia limi DSM 17137]|uniref:Diguanylate cyclase (GGDEF) domain-containing protein n=1 Tax=Devosia limi DSM 17137 TaxID=1121477 RepID=A0A0F5LUU2_9HYPH|nr:hypothetical protein VW29_04415 [Devosia limi DSM 17137]
MLLRLQTEVLEAVAYGKSLANVVEILCHHAELLAPEVMCSILTVDADGRLHPLAAPSLPQGFSDAVEGLAIGPGVGSCGTAAYRNEPVLVTDIAADPLWVDFRDLALSFGLHACWSSPIRARDGRVVATFAFYYRTRRGPTDLERRIVETCVHLCTIALDHEAGQQRNYRLAYYDALTGLPNRGHFRELLTSYIETAHPFGLLFVDIDQLKTTNDALGHDVGDVLIHTIGQRIEASDPAFRTSRMGGDEFAVLVSRSATPEALAQAASTLLSSVKGLIQAGDNTIEPHVTIGGALFGPDGVDADSLCQNADFALISAKETHRGGYLRFQPGMRTQMVERINMVHSVDLALADHRMLPHYQPVVRLDTGAIVGLEALARMRTPDGRIASAGEFHVALADPRIAYELTGSMLAQVAADLRNWLDAGIAIEYVGINVTTGDFQRGDLEQRIVSAFETAGVPLHHALLEVNEAVFMGGSDGRVPRAVEALRKRGLKVALDDFGTGFASLTHLLSFPVDIIKIDKSFVDRLGSDAPSTVIVQAIIDITRKLGMQVIAEGVETVEQAQILRSLGCRSGQGFLYARPVSAAEAVVLLSTPDPTRRSA